MSETWHTIETGHPILKDRLFPIYGYTGLLAKALNSKDFDIARIALDPKVVTRIVRGQTDSLCDNPTERRIVFFAPALLAPTIEDLLIPVGYPTAEIATIRADKNIPLHMIVTHMDLLDGQLFPATWENICDLASQSFSIPNPEESGNIAFARANYPGKSYAEIDAQGPPFNLALPTFVKIAGIKPLFGGNGHSLIENGLDIPHRPEYVMLNRPRNSIPGVEINLRMFVRPKVSNP